MSKTVAVVVNISLVIVIVVVAVVRRCYCRYCYYCCLNEDVLPGDDANFFAHALFVTGGIFAC